ncbi:MAG: ATP-binding protein [Acidimicrobiales bacterium]
MVSDDGVGMDPEIVDRITERFFADRSRSRQKGGSGLGLAIVDAVVAAHGGTLGIESAPGAGTTVTVALPRTGHAG